MDGGATKGANFIASCWADARKVTPNDLPSRQEPPRQGGATPPVGIIVFPGSGITDNLADKARKFGMPVWRFGGRACAVRLRPPDGD